MPSADEIDTGRIRRIAEAAAEAAVREHQKDCPSISAVAASLADMRDEVRTGFNRVHERFDGIRDTVAGAMNVSGRHSERLKALERKRRETADGSSGMSPGNSLPAHFPTPRDGIVVPAPDAEERPLISPKLINNAITALVVAIAAAAGTAAWNYVTPPAKTPPALTTPTPPTPTTPPHP